jgi:3-mercaptopyruvate sulfurtransferase SseA
VQSSFAAAEIACALGAEVFALKGGTRAWAAAGYTLEQGATHLLSEPIDRYKRPYEGTDNAQAAMQAYLDWEFGLVEQLGRDGTHHFSVLKSA